ncbi:MAG: hypothetical protein KDK33_15220 [Leptospiraceae bacterium]|nr:hypothetical protein [Leptospiraceae bacterium]
MRNGSTLEPAYDQYKASGSVHDFVEQSYEWMLRYTRRKLNKDQEVCHEFLSHFLEKIPKILVRFERESREQFTGYLAWCMRYDFLNFIRQRRKQEPPVCEYPVEWLAQPAESQESTGLEHAIQQLKALQRIPVKLQWGWNLDIKDFRWLVSNCGAHRTSRLQECFQKKIEKEQIRRQHLQNQMATYFFRMRRGLNGRNYGNLRKRKMEAEHRAPRTVLSLREMGEFLQLSKAALHRHIARARLELRHLLESQALGSSVSRVATYSAGILAQEDRAVLYQFNRVEHRQFLLLERPKKLEPLEISLYTPQRLCYKLGLSAAIALPLHLWSAGFYELRAGKDLRLRFRIVI